MTDVLGVPQEQPMHDQSHCLQCNEDFLYRPSIDSYEYCQGCLSKWWEKHSADRINLEKIEDDLDDARSERDSLRQELDVANEEIQGLKRKVEELMALGGVVDKLKQIREMVEAIPVKGSNEAQT